MHVLAIETSIQPGSIALLRGDMLLQHVRLDHQQRTTQSLIPAIKQMLAQNNVPPPEVDLIAVSEGPGSFTGLRIGMTVAKTFAFVTQSRTVAINTMDVIAAGCQLTSAHCSVVMDAQRKQLFTALYKVGSQQIRRISDVSISSIEDWLTSLTPNHSVTGPGLERIVDRLPANCTVASAQNWEPSAVALGQLALQQVASIQTDDFWKMVPNYYRKSAAEEKAGL